MEVSNTFVCLMGIGTVFIGLICIILLCKIMSFLCNKFGNDNSKTKKIAKPIENANTAEIPNKQELIAGICAVIAEELGTDVKNIRVLSFK